MTLDGAQSPETGTASPLGLGRQGREAGDGGPPPALGSLPS